MKKPVLLGLVGIACLVCAGSARAESAAPTKANCAVLEKLYGDEFDSKFKKDIEENNIAAQLWDSWNQNDIKEKAETAGLFNQIALSIPQDVKGLLIDYLDGKLSPPKGEGEIAKVLRRQLKTSIDARTSHSTAEGNSLLLEVDPDSPGYYEVVYYSWATMDSPLPLPYKKRHIVTGIERTDAVKLLLNRNLLSGQAQLTAADGLRVLGSGLLPKPGFRNLDEERKAYVTPYLPADCLEAVQAPGQGYELFLDGVRVNGSETATWIEAQGLVNCKWNLEHNGGQHQVTCRYNGQEMRP